MLVHAEGPATDTPGTPRHTPARLSLTEAVRPTGITLSKLYMLIYYTMLGIS